MKILVFGDSITQGYYDLKYGGWVNKLFVYVMNLSAKSNWKVDHTVFNLGISGDRTDKLNLRFENEFTQRVKNEKSELLTLFAIGINDSASNKKGKCRVSPEVFEKNMESFICNASAHGRVAVVGLTPVDESALDPIPWSSAYSYLEGNRAKFDNILGVLAKRHNCLYIKTNDLYKDFSKYTTDGIHPNADGHQLIFERVKDCLELEGII